MVFNRNLAAGSIEYYAEITVIKAKLNKNNEKAHDLTFVHFHIFAFPIDGKASD